MNMMTFDFETLPVRAFERDGTEWFVGKDVCRCLGISDHHQALGRLPDNERGGYEAPTPRGAQEMICVTEPGLFRLIFASAKPEAERLKNFVFHEVLPALRRTGAYTPEPDFEILREKLAMVREARLTHGKAAAQAMWREMGLPLPPDEQRGGNGRETDMQRDLYGHIADFLEQCCEPSPPSMVKTSELHKVYNQWASRCGAPYATLTAFGLSMRLSSYRRHKSGTVYYAGLRIRDDARRKVMTDAGQPRNP